MKLYVVEKPRTNIYANPIYNMRQSGATLQQIADKLNRTRERIRQILVKHYGSTKYELISTEQLRKRLGFTRYRVMQLYQHRVITPKREWYTNDVCYLLWSPDTVEQVITYLNTRRICKMCHRPVPVSRRIFCSDECYKEDHKYKYRSTIDRKRHPENIERYGEKNQLLAQVPAER